MLSKAIKVEYKASGVCEFAKWTPDPIYVGFKHQRAHTSVLRRTNFLHNETSIYEHCSRYNEEPTLVTGPSICFASNERGGIQQMEKWLIIHSL
jgi:hypothetical protein